MKLFQYKKKVKWNIFKYFKILKLLMKKKILKPLMQIAKILSKRAVLLLLILINIKSAWDFPGCPVVKTPSFQCKGLRFDPWFRN